MQRSLGASRTLAGKFLHWSVKFAFVPSLVRTFFSFSRQFLSLPAGQTNVKDGVSIFESLQVAAVGVHFDMAAFLNDNPKMRR